MNLIPIAVGPLGDEIQTTDARNLHGFLEVGRIFAAWIQDRIAEYKFVEGRDFVVFSGSGNNPQGGRPSREYAITLEMAKELAMVERTDKGREARQYFIECERKLHMVKQPSELSRLDILKLAMESEEGRLKAEAEVLELTHVVEQQKPAVEFVDRFVEAKSAKGFREVAKILGVKERDFISDLSTDKIIFKQGSNWLPMAEHQHAGRFTVKTGEANGHAYVQTRFTPEGIAWVAKRYTGGSSLTH
jgi:anti-repressor protein